MDKQLPKQAPDAPIAHVQHRLLRWLWMGAGLLLGGLGGLGIIVPVLPSTVFFIGAAACFARSSPRFEQWVLDLPRIGPVVRDYRRGLGMPRRAKISVVIVMLIAIVLSSTFIPSWAGRALAIGVALVGVWFVLVHVPTRERVLVERERNGT